MKCKREREEMRQAYLRGVETRSARSESRCARVASANVTADSTALAPADGSAAVEIRVVQLIRRCIQQREWFRHSGRAHSFFLSVPFVK